MNTSINLCILIFIFIKICDLHKNLYIHSGMFFGKNVIIPHGIVVSQIAKIYWTGTKKVILKCLTKETGDGKISSLYFDMKAKDADPYLKSREIFLIKAPFDDKTAYQVSPIQPSALINLKSKMDSKCFKSFPQARKINIIILFLYAVAAIIIPAVFVSPIKNSLAGTALLLCSLWIIAANKPIMVWTKCQKICIIENKAEDQNEKKSRDSELAGSARPVKDYHDVVSIDNDEKLKRIAEEMRAKKEAQIAKSKNEEKNPILKADDSKDAADGNKSPTRFEKQEGNTEKSKENKSAKTNKSSNDKKQGNAPSNNGKPSEPNKKPELKKDFEQGKEPDQSEKNKSKNTGTNGNSKAGKSSSQKVGVDLTGDSSFNARDFKANVYTAQSSPNNWESKGKDRKVTNKWSDM